MKVQVLVSKPKSLDITLNEMMEKWHMLELIPGLECHFYTYDKSLTSEEISNIIDSDTEAVIGVYLRKDLITEISLLNIQSLNIWLEWLTDMRNLMLNLRTNTVLR